MTIFAAIKKSINSNLNKPLNITLDEIKAEVATPRKPSRKVARVVGVPYNTTYDSQVLSLNDEPVLSVKGSGRIETIIPVFSGSASESMLGTALITVDDEVILNNAVRYATRSSTVKGYTLVDATDNHGREYINSDIFGTEYPFYFMAPVVCLLDASEFSPTCGGIVSYHGIPFKNGFELRLTQRASQTETTAGAIVVYELDE